MSFENLRSPCLSCPRRYKNKSHPACVYCSDRQVYLMRLNGFSVPKGYRVVHEVVSCASADQLPGPEKCKFPGCDRDASPITGYCKRHYKLCWARLRDGRDPHAPIVRGRKRRAAA